MLVPTQTLTRLPWRTAENPQIQVSEDCCLVLKAQGCNSCQTCQVESEYLSLILNFFPFNKFTDVVFIICLCSLPLPKAESSCSIANQFSLGLKKFFKFYDGFHSNCVSMIFHCPVSGAAGEGNKWALVLDGLIMSLHPEQPHLLVSLTANIPSCSRPRCFIIQSSTDSVSFEWP